MEITRPNQVHSDGARLRISRCRAGLGDPPGSVVAALDHDGGGVLHRDLEDALARHGKPEIFNTDPGSAFTGALASNGIAISMDGKGAWRDNVFVERLWRSVKYEEVYLRAYESVGRARDAIGRYLDFYNRRRPHSSLDGSTPDQAYFNPLPIRMAA
jgi:Integrase core domain